MALTGGAGPPSAFPLLKVDRQCCNGDCFSQPDPKRTFTGSTEVGKLPMQQCGDTVKKLSVMDQFFKVTHYQALAGTGRQRPVHRV
jgi:hypothetical protein